MHRPLIGISTGLDAQGRQGLDGAYVEAVERAGGVPLLLPLSARAETLHPLLGLIGGLIITGGPGIVRGLVGELPADLPPVSKARDRADSRAFEGAHAQGKPVLGICYGMQFINARCGGTIYADAQRQLGVGPHAPGRNGGEEVRHEIRVEPRTRLWELVGGERACSNSAHIQAVQRLGAGLRLSARSDDGLVEGLESPDGRLLGVQFHPERMPGSVWERLFEDLVERAKKALDPLPR